MYELQKELLAYATHEFGNYVVQHALRFFAYELVRPLYDYLLGNFTRLSMDKYSSNLIEFAIEKADSAL